MWNETNPTSLYLGTTWELISAGKYIQTGSIALQTGGSNSLEIEKTNLPATKVQLDSFSLSRGTMEITGHFRAGSRKFDAVGDNTGGAFVLTSWGTSANAYDAGTNSRIYSDFNFTASRSWTGTTNTAQPQTINLGDGTPLTIQPEYITLKMWKRTS